ncbi:MAG: tetratricopeptide repeat protein, partial [Candidatus Latescibacteria bacterium]|nr:tetratricopeptide repeat protein [Candidatus Latescibacterota bacterium]
IDENGNDSPPVLLSRFDSVDRAANIPEFVNIGFDDFLSLDEKFIDYYSYFNKAGQMFDQGRYAEAEKFLLKSIKLNPDYAMAHKNLGFVLTKLKRFDEAEKEWETALTLDIDDPMINVNLGSIYLGRNDLEKARRMFADALAKDPNLTPAHIGLGVTYLIGNDLDKAQEKFEDAVKADPEYDDGYYRLGIVYLRREKFDKAEAMFKKALEMNKRNANACLGLAQVLARDERTIPDAITYYNKGMGLISTNPHDHIRQGNIYLKQGDVKRAMAEFDKLLQINPGSQSLKMYVNQLKQQKVSSR